MANGRGTGPDGKVCMLTYAEAPSQLPPMLHEALSLARTGIAVECLCFASAPDAQLAEEQAPAFLVRRFHLRTRSFFRSIGRPRLRRLLSGLQWALSYAEYVAKALLHALRSRADVYEAHDLPPLLPAVLAAKLRRKPVVYRAHELWSEIHARVPFAWMWRWLDRLLVPRCDEVVTPEENRSRIYLVEMGAKRPPLTIRNCPPYRPPVQSARLREDLARRKIPFSTVVLYQGLFESGRCIEEMAEASRHFAEGVVLALIGSGFGKWGDPAAATAGYDRVVVLPRVPYEELPSYTASADIGILLYRDDCRNNYYCAPNKVFEYMMMGLPVIAPGFPGMLKLVEGEAVGLCVNPREPLSIARAVNRLASDPEMRARMRENGLRLSRERYRWDVESRPLMERHRSLLHRARGTGP